MGIFVATTPSAAIARSSAFAFFAAEVADLFWPPCLSFFEAESGEFDMLEDRFFRPLIDTFFFAVVLSAAVTFDSNVIDWSFLCGDEEEEESEADAIDDKVDGATEEEDDDERNCITPFGS